MNKLILRILLLMPWLFLVWLIGQGMSGAVDGLLVFALLFILIPGAMVLNLLTVIAVQGNAAFKVMRDMQNGRAPGSKQKKIKSTNYADLPWWNPKRWR